MSKHRLHRRYGRAAKRPTLDAFTRGYVTAALWSSNDDSDESGGVPLDTNYSVNDIATATLAKMAKDCASFQKANVDDLAASGMSDEDAGHNFWLNRNGHGVGFWDRGLGELGDRLSKACKPYGEFNLYVGDDGKVHGS